MIGAASIVWRSSTRTGHSPSLRHDADCVVQAAQADIAQTLAGNTHGAQTWRRIE